MSAESESPKDEGLGEPPDADLVARAMRRSRVAKLLFETDEPVQLGRYRVLERVGAGGTGVVYGAWDPELERRVAIKLIKPSIQAARDRILLEGQALAKLSHPNVVSVHDVGVVGDQVYLVMEWVRGETLRVHCARPRAVREIVGLYRAAGEGLHAAHLAGVIHRDFKPDNAIRGDDGRVRVLDFGLAGTPRYMAPEQTAGATLTAAVDQYAFAVSLGEALEHRGAIPGWIAAILDRSKQADPADRYPSMAELLRALARDPTRIWRRRLFVGLAAALVGVAFFAGSTRRSQPGVTPCEGGDADLARTWNDTTRARLVEHIRGLGPYGAAEADGLARELARFGSQWVTAHRTSCLAHERRETTDTTYERNLACLARSRVSFDTVIEVLAKATPARLSNAIVAARTLPAAEHCALDSLLSTMPPPPRALAVQASQLANDIERARILAGTDDPQGVAATQHVVARAIELGYAPLVARAKLALGHALLETDQAEAAIAVLDEAALAAVDAFDDAAFVEAYARLVYARSVVQKPEPAPRTELPFVVHVGHRAGRAGGFARALLFNNLGVARLSAGDDAAARVWFDTSLAETEARERNTELVATLTNRALVTPDQQARDRLFEQARSTLARLLGANHRRTLEVQLQAAFFITDDARAASELDRLCTLYQRVHARVAAASIGHCLYEVGWLAEASGQVAAARKAFSEMPEHDGPASSLAKAHLLALDGKLAEATLAARSVADTFRDRTWARFNAADALLLAASCEAKLQQRDAAIADARAALALFEQQSHLAQLAHYQRRLARVRALLASLGASPR